MSIWVYIIIAIVITLIVFMKNKTTMIDLCDINEATTWFNYNIDIFDDKSIKACVLRKGNKLISIEENDILILAILNEEKIVKKKIIKCNKIAHDLKNLFDKSNAIYFNFTGEK